MDAASPNEACGLIFGEVEETKVEGGFQYHYIAKIFECFESSEKSPVSFLIDNLELLNEKFEHAYNKHKLNLISIFHSHPGGSYPSGVDTRNMEYLDDCGNKAFKNQIWTIMDASTKELNGYIYLQNEFLQINVQKKE